MSLLQHIDDHEKLFKLLAMARNSAIDKTLHGQKYHKLSAFIDENGKKHEIEPERSIIVPNYEGFQGVKQLLQDNIPNLTLIRNSDCGFRYPTAAIDGPNQPLIKRFRSDLFYKDEDRKIYVPKHMSYGIKSAGKADNRLEYEVDIDPQNITADPAQLFIDKYGDDLPANIKAFAQIPPVVHGWMGVKRAAFEGIYTDKSTLGDISILIAFSVDAFNIGAKPDLSFHKGIGSSIAVQNAELEWEGMGYITPKGHSPSNAEIWNAMNTVIPLIGDTVDEIYDSIIIPSSESKTERILSTVFDHGATAQSIANQNLKPQEFLQTKSAHRFKRHAPERSINLLGRLNRLNGEFNHASTPSSPFKTLPHISDMHELMDTPRTNAKIFVPQNYGSPKI